MKQRKNASSTSISEDAATTSQFSTNYTALKVLHRGRHALVVRAQDLNNSRWMAVKAYAAAALPPSGVEQIRTEVSIMKRIREHSGVARMHTTFEEDGQIFIVTEYCSGGTLLEMIAAMGGRVPERVAMEIAVSLLRTLEYLHSKRIVHRDIKPDHLVRNESGEWKLIDFANAVEMGVQYCNARAGSLPYMAPEVLAKPSSAEVFHEVLDKGLSEEELPAYCEKADIWSVGATLYEALTGRQPFLGESPSEMSGIISAAVSSTSVCDIPDFLAHSGISAGAQLFLSNLLQVDPDVRPSAAEALQHIWLLRGARQSC